MNKKHFKLAKLLMDNTNDINELKENTLAFYLLLFKTDKNSYGQYKKDWENSHEQI